MCHSYQVEATTEKRPMVTKASGLFSRAAKCTEIAARPDFVVFIDPIFALSCN